MNGGSLTTHGTSTPKMDLCGCARSRTSWNHGSCLLLAFHHPDHHSTPVGDPATADPRMVRGFVQPVGVPATVRPIGPAVGSKFGLPHGGSNDGGDILYVAMSAHCGVCEGEADSYRSLEQALDGAQGATVLYLMPEEEAAGRRFLNGHGLRGGVEFGTAFRGSGITGFPTVLLVDRQSIVRFSHIGRLTADDKQRLETAISQCAASTVAGRKVSSGK